VTWSAGVPGPFSRHFEEKLSHFRSLLDHPDVRLRQIGEMAVGHLTASRNAELKKERRAVVRGEPM